MKTTSFVQITHTCREAGYSPYVKACPACLSQPSKNGAEHTKKAYKK